MASPTCSTSSRCLAPVFAYSLVNLAFVSPQSTHRQQTHAQTQRQRTHTGGAAGDGARADDLGPAALRHPAIAERAPRSNKIPLLWCSFCLALRLLVWGFYSVCLWLVRPACDNSLMICSCLSIYIDCSAALRLCIVCIPMDVPETLLAIAHILGAFVFEKPDVRSLAPSRSCPCCFGPWSAFWVLFSRCVVTLCLRIFDFALQLSVCFEAIPPFSVRTQAQGKQRLQLSLYSCIGVPKVPCVLFQLS